MKKFHIPIIEEYKLYEVGSITMIGQNENRRFASNIDNGGNVHLNILKPGAQSGNHYHKVVKEFFINSGPDILLLHLKDMETGLLETIEMQPPTTISINAYRVKHNVPHMIENASA